MYHNRRLFPRLLWLADAALRGTCRRPIRRGPAILVGVLAFIVYQGVFVIFDR